MAKATCYDFVSWAVDECGRRHVRIARARRLADGARYYVGFDFDDATDASQARLRKLINAHKNGLQVVENGWTWYRDQEG